MPGGVAHPGGNPIHTHFIGVDSVTAGMGGNARGPANGMSGLDESQGNYSTADGSVKQADTAQWLAALVLAAKAKGGTSEFPRRGSVSRRLH